jgi:alcohol dehydrogenase (cytochrome c)
MTIVKRKGRLVAFLVIAILVLVVAAFFSIGELRWRADLLLMKLKGDIPDVSLVQLTRWSLPGSAVFLGDMAEYRSLDAAVRNAKTNDQTYIDLGTKQFQQHCSSCHGGDAKGATGPDLVAFVKRSTDWSFLSTVKWGRPGTAMAAQSVTDEQIWQIHTSLQAKARAGFESAKTLSGPTIDVPSTRLADAEKYPDDWLTYSGQLTGHRHSSLAQINRDNLSDLRVAWAAQMRSTNKAQPATPIVVNGTMFITEGPDSVLALNARTGRVIWRFRRAVNTSQLPLCCGAFSRGVAVMDNRVFVATLDAYLIALDASTGEKLWEVKVASSSDGYSMTSAPFALEGHIVVGVAGGEYGIRGFVAAFSPNDGKSLWRFDAIPGPDEPGHETWAGDSWKTGGASTWALGAYDKGRDVIYWPIGNPWPPLDSRARQGDNLFSNSVVALDRKTGKMRWYFQFTPGDSHDWDATQQMILADINWQGEVVPAILLANRNAFYYALDRRDGRFLRATAYVTQNWVAKFDEKGRPINNGAVQPSSKGTLIWPWVQGATNWWAPSYDSKRKLHFVPTVDAATMYLLIDSKNEPGNMAMGGTTHFAHNQPAAMAIKALDPESGAVRWSTRLDDNDYKSNAAIAGLVSTDGGIVVAGYSDRLSVLDSDSGKILWGFRPGGPINAGAITYAVDNVQYIAIVAGNVLFAFSLAPRE